MVTIIRADNVVYIDGRPRAVDCSSLDPAIHAIQWNSETERGSIEFVDADPTDGFKEPNQAITSVADYQQLIDAALGDVGFDNGKTIRQMLGD